MTEGFRRVGIRCLKCDHPIVTLPEDYHFSGTLTCPGCGEIFELPEKAESLVEKTEKGLRKTAKGPNGSGS